MVRNVAVFLKPYGGDAHRGGPATNRLISWCSDKHMHMCGNASNRPLDPLYTSPLRQKTKRCALRPPGASRSLTAASGQSRSPRLAHGSPLRRAHAPPPTLLAPPHPGASRATLPGRPAEAASRRDIPRRRGCGHGTRGTVTEGIRAMINAETVPKTT